MMPRTRRPIVADLKRSIAPMDFYTRELATLPSPNRSGGWVDGGLCPFHPDKRTGNFRINVDTGAFRCFSCQAAGGDIIDFVQLQRACTFPDALDVLMREFGVRA